MQNGLGIGQGFFIDSLNIEKNKNTHLKPKLEKVVLAFKKTLTIKNYP